MVEGEGRGGILEVRGYCEGMESRGIDEVPKAHRRYKGKHGHGVNTTVPKLPLQAAKSTQVFGQEKS